MGQKYRIIYEIFVCKNFFFFWKKISKMFKGICNNTANVFVANHEYSKAVRYLEKNNKKDTFQYAYCLEALGKKNEATNVMKNVLKLNYCCEDKDIINFIKNRFNIDEKNEILKYEYLGGYANLGFVTYYTNSKPTKITKILDVTKINNEEIFYTKHNDMFKSEKVFVPTCYDSCIFNDKIKLLTFQYIEHNQLNNDYDEQVISINKIIESYKNKQFLQNCGHKERIYQGNNEVSNLHKKNTYNMMQEKMLNLLRGVPNSEALSNMIMSLTQKIVDKKIYKSVIEHDFYSFCHNDFHKKNMFVSDGNVYIIDWNNYRNGLKGWDMIYYWGNFERGFEYIRCSYIEKYVHTSEKSEKYWRILFSYCLIYVWVDRLHNESPEKYMNDYFLPAVEYVKQIFMDL